MGLEQLPIRVNGDDINADWFNQIRSYGLGTASTGITAFAGGGQTNGTAITSDVNIVTVCATNNDSVKLSAASSVGTTRRIYNSTIKTCAVFPSTGQQIDSLGANNAYSVGAGVCVDFQCTSIGVWTAFYIGVAPAASSPVSYDGINYILNSEATVDTSGWTRYKTTSPTSTPTTFGGTPDPEVTWTRNTTSPLSSTADFLLTKDGSDRLGNGVYYETTLQSADYSSILRVLFKYKNSDLMNDYDIGIFIVSSGDNFVSDINVIELSKRNLDDTLIPKSYIGEAQMDAQDTKIRFCIHIAYVTAAAYTVNFSRLILGPRELARTTMVTEPKLYTPTFTGFGTVSGVNIESWRSGSYAYFEGRFTVGTTTATEARMTLGFNGTNGGILSNSDYSTLEMVGTATKSEVGTTVNIPILIEPSTGYITFGNVVSGSSAGLAKANASSIITTGTISFFCKIRIAGWTSTTVISSDIRSSLISSYAHRNGSNQTLTMNNTEEVPNWTSKSLSVGRGWDTTNSQKIVPDYRWVCPETGYYDYNVRIRMGGANTLNSKYSLFGWFAGTSNVLDTITPQAGTEFVLQGSGKIYLTAGQDAYASIYGAGNNSVSTIPLTGGAGNSFFIITKVQTPSVFALPELIASRVYLSANQSLTNNTVTKAALDTVDYDTHLVWNLTTNTMTSPQTGYYRFHGNLNYATNATASRAVGYFYSGEGANQYIASVLAAGSTSSTRVNFSFTQYMPAGSTLYINGFQDSGGSLNLVSGSTNRTFVCCEKLM